MAGVRKRLGSLLGPTGRAARLTGATVETVAAHIPASVIEGGTDLARSLAFKLPQAIPGPDVAPTIDSVAAMIAQPSAARTAVNAAVATVGDGRYRRVLSELRTVASGADARALIQSALAAASGLGTSELVLPEGDWRFLSAADGAAGDASALKITTSDITIRGAGIGKTRISGGIGRNLVGVMGALGNRLSNVGISDMTIEGDGATSNQRGIGVYYADKVRLDRIKIHNVGNNGINVFYTDGASLTDVEVSGANDFGILVYRSSHTKVVDAYIHDINKGRSHLGLQFKSSRYCRAVRPRIERIQGYGFYTWDDELDVANYPDKGHTLEDAYISDMLAGGGFVPTAAYINETEGVQIRGGRFIESAAGLISARDALNLSVADIAELTGAHGAPALGISGVSSFRVRGVSANGRGVSNEIGFLASGTPVYGSLRDSHFINGGAGAAVADNAAARLEPTVQGVFVEGNDFSDYQAVKTQRRGMYDRTAAGVNYWRNNKSIGNTTSNKQLPAGSIDTGNIIP